MRLPWKNPVRDGFAILSGAVFAHSLYFGPSAYDQVLAHALGDGTLLLSRVIGGAIGLVIGGVCFEHYLTDKTAERRLATRLDISSRALIAWPMLGLGVAPILFALAAYLFLCLDFISAHSGGLKTAAGAFFAGAIISLIAAAFVVPLVRALRTRDSR